MIRKPLHVKLRPPQYQVFNDNHRFKAVVAGRRFGKTWLSRTWLLDGGIRHPGTINWYTAPTYRQAKALMWRPLKQMVPQDYIKSKYETDMTMELINGSIIALRGTDNPDSLRGSGLHRLVLDECAFMADTVWEEILRPQLADTLGSALFITTPKSFNWFYDLTVNAANSPDWAVFHFTTADGGNVSKEELEQARVSMDPRTYAQEFEASFLNMAGRVYYAFDIMHNIIDKPTGFNMDGLPLLVGMDFNVDPMSATCGVRVGGEFHVVGEVSIPNGNTEIMAQALKNRWPGRPIIVYPDPTADRRQTNAPAGQTDITILRSHGFGVVTPGVPWPTADKINVANAAFCNADNIRRVYVWRGVAPKLVRALSGLTYKEGTNIPDKDGGLDHASDSLAYLLCMEFPIVQPTRRIRVVGI